MDTSFTICTHAVDVPSLGSLLYQTLCGEPGTYAGTGSARYELDFVCTLLCCCFFFFSPEEDTASFSGAAAFSGFTAFQ